MRVRTTTAESAEAGAPEIEVTPAMIEAGVTKLFDYDPRFSNEEEIVRAIWREMLLAREGKSQ